MIQMPIVRPVPIPTKGLPWYRRARQAFRPREWELVEDFAYTSTTLRHSILVPAPFIFDGASVPRPLWPFLDPTGLLFLGALVHDFGYRYRGLLLRTRPTLPWQFERLTRSEIDETMRVIVCEVNDMSGMAGIANAAVRVGGWWAWRNNGRGGHCVTTDYPFLMAGATR